jgi:hypothetical protein
MLTPILAALAAAAVQIPADFKFTAVEDAKVQVRARVNVIAYCGKANVTHDVELKNKTNKSVCVWRKDCGPGAITLDILDAKGTRMTNGKVCSAEAADARVARKDMSVVAPGADTGVAGIIAPYYETAPMAFDVWKPMPLNRSYTARVRVPVFLDCEAALAACGKAGCEWRALETSGKVHAVELKQLKVFNLGQEDCPAE